MTTEHLGEQNAALIRTNFESFLAGDVARVVATWADHAVWHVLDANRFVGTYTKHEYFSMLGGPWVEQVQDYELRLVSVTPFGEHLVVAHVVSSGTTPDGPIDPGGGLLIYRVEADRVVEGWALSRGQDAVTPF